jgi:hypothetical protein
LRKETDEVLLRRAGLDVADVQRRRRRVEIVKVLRRRREKAIRMWNRVLVDEVLRLVDLGAIGARRRHARVLRRHDAQPRLAKRHVRHVLYRTLTAKTCGQVNE